MKSAPFRPKNLPEGLYYFSACIATGLLILIVLPLIAELAGHIQSNLHELIRMASDPHTYYKL